ncbi:hypothetical protein BASA61_008689 [Batrachochytrium salamandrivorans]|nr:hypothetical protein BASA61_008689 [Batrachochytrium salamandrivorans]
MTAALLLVLPASSDEVISVLAHATEPDAALPVPVDEEAVAISASDAALIAAAARVVLTLRVLLLSMAALKSLCLEANAVIKDQNEDVLLPSNLFTREAAQIERISLHSGPRISVGSDPFLPGMP